MIANSKKLLIVINTDQGLDHAVNIYDRVKA